MTAYRTRDRRRRLRRGRLKLLAWALIAMCAEPRAAEPSLAGLPVEEAIRLLEARGLSVVYSTDLVTPTLRVLSEPDSSDPATMLREILAPHHLDVVPGPNGRQLIVRSRAPPRAETSSPPPAKLEAIVVTASRYRLTQGTLEGAAVLNAQDLVVLPEIGEDPIRAVAWLPGVSRQDFVSKPYIRGGIADETLVRFDGLRLYDPYHLKDFQSPFSSIDPSIVKEMTIQTAGFPVAYGDRLSGVVDISPVRPGSEFGGRFSLSLFNTIGLLGGPLDDGRGEWMVSARRGNLDFVVDAVDSNLGRPTYGDVYFRLAHDLGSRMRLSANVLLSDDDLEVSDRDQEEDAVAEYRDEYYWLDLEWGNDDAAGAKAQLAHTELTRERAGESNLPGVTTGGLDDQRRFTIDTLAFDGWWMPRTDSRLSAGLEWRAVDGRYDYHDQVAFDLLFLYPGAQQQPDRVRQLQVRPSGDHYAAYFDWQFAATDRLKTNLGLRWDRETLSPHGSDYLGPRAGVLWEAGPRTRVRASWGRYFQAQGVDEISVSDGDTNVYPGQHAEHWIAGLERDLRHGLGLRLEAYRKQYDDLRPRYENLLNPLVVLPELMPDRIRIAPDSALANGIEVSLDYRSGPVSGWLGYSWAAVEDRIDGRDIPRSWDQSHAVNMGVSYLGSKWDFTFAATWRSGWPTTKVELLTLEPFPLVATGPRNAERLGTYLRFDARVARRFDIGPRQRLTVFLEANNLTNRRNDCCVEYQIETDVPDPYLDIGPLDSLPFVPTLGVVWEF